MELWVCLLLIPLMYVCAVHVSYGFYYCAGLLGYPVALENMLVLRLGASSNIGLFICFFPLLLMSYLHLDPQTLCLRVPSCLIYD